MAKYRLSNEAKEDLIRIHQYGIKRFGIVQADKYFDSFFEYFEMIAERPFSFESVDYLKKGYRRCVCGVDSIYFKINEDTRDNGYCGKTDLNKSVRLNTLTYSTLKRRVAIGASSTTVRACSPGSGRVPFDEY